MCSCGRRLSWHHHARDVLVLFLLACSMCSADVAEAGPGANEEVGAPRQERSSQEDSFQHGTQEQLVSPDQRIDEEVLEWEVVWFDRKLNVLDFDDEEGANHFVSKFEGHTPYQVLRHRVQQRLSPEQGVWPESWPQVWPMDILLRQHESWSEFETLLQRSVEEAAAERAAGRDHEQTPTAGLAEESKSADTSRLEKESTGGVGSPEEHNNHISLREDALQAASVEDLLLPLHGRCFTHKEGYWHYELCPFQNASQFHSPGNQPETSRAAENNIGLFASVQLLRPPIQTEQGRVSPPVLVHRYTGGSDCGERGHRELMVTWLCAEAAVGGEEARHRVDSLVETQICKYHMTFHTAVLCRQPPPSTIVPHSQAPSFSETPRETAPTSLTSVGPVSAALPSASAEETPASSADGAQALQEPAQAEGKGDPAEWARVGLDGDGKRPYTEMVAAGPLAVRNRLGLKVGHCFNLNASCSVTLWLWLRPSATDGMPQVERAILTAKERMHTISPHLLWGFPQAPGQLFCGMHSVSDNQMVGSFNGHPLATNRWLHLSVVFHRHSRMECVVDGIIQTTVPVKTPVTLQANPPGDLQNMYLGGSARWHVSVTGAMADVRMHHHQALTPTAIVSIMRALPPQHQLFSTSSSLALAAPPPNTAAGQPAISSGSDGAESPMTSVMTSPLASSAAAAPRGVTRPSGNQSLGHWHHVERLLEGKDHALLALGHRQLLGIGGLQPSCETAAIYYRAAAEQAVQEIGSADAAAVEFVRLSEEEEKGNAFEGHYGEDDDVLKYQQQLADGGDARAQAWLGHRYYWGVGGVQRDRQRAVQYLDQAARQGHVEAQYNLGVMRAYGHGIEKDRAESIRLFREAADKGYVAAQNGLALSLTDGSPDNNFTEAFKYFNKSAQAGNADGLYNAALLLRDGRGVDKNEDLAYRYMVMAVRLDHQTARLALGWMLLEGKGAPQSCPEAVGYLKAAAERGRWGMLLRDGLDAYLAGDIDGALDKYEAAAELGYEVAQSNAAWLYTHHCPSSTCSASSQTAQVRARALLEGAALNGHPEAMRLLGDSLWYGLDHHGSDLDDRAVAMSGGVDVEPDVGQGLEYYRRGAEKGDIQSAFNVAVAYYFGSAVQRNVTEARKWVREGLRGARRARAGSHLYPLLLLKWAIQAEAAVSAWWKGQDGTREGEEEQEEEEEGGFEDELEEAWEAGAAEMMMDGGEWEVQVHVELPDMSWIKEGLGAGDATWEEFLSAEGLVLVPMVLYLVVTFVFPALQSAARHALQAGRGEGGREEPLGAEEEAEPGPRDDDEVGGVENLGDDYDQAQ